MKEKTQARPCASCSGQPSGFVKETFADSGSAFRRHAQLVQAGNSPSFCMGRDGTCRVCHFGEAAAPV
ncbi:MAG: hypothetical protein H6R10_2244 [Rhodocyclaceae bacterium]|nr:hypothetical protein [Rhodocyclaceae bacterium]